MRKTSVFNFISGLAISLKKEQELMFKDLDIKLIIYMIHEERCSLRVLYTFQKSSSKSIQSLNFFLIQKGILASEQYDND